MKSLFTNAKSTGSEVNRNGAVLTDGIVPFGGAWFAGSYHTGSPWDLQVGRTLDPLLILGRLQLRHVLLDGHPAAVATPWRSRRAALLRADLGHLRPGLARQILVVDLRLLADHPGHEREEALRVLGGHVR